jgi:hypothetical protein
MAFNQLARHDHVLDRVGKRPRMPHSNQNHQPNG